MDEDEMKREIDKVAPAMLRVLEHYKFIESWDYSEGAMIVRFTDVGRENLKRLLEILPADLWPKNFAEFLCLRMVCDIARDQSQTDS